MGWLKKLKKKAKKITFNKVAKELTKGITPDNVIDLLPAPVGTIAKTGKSIVDKAKKIGKKTGLSALSSGKKGKGKSAKPKMIEDSPVLSQVTSNLSPREQRKIERQKKRMAKKRARADGYASYK